MLSTPQVVLDVIRMGPLRRIAESIRALLTDPRRTQCLLLTLPEELPVSETLELAAALRKVPVALAGVLVTRREPAPGLARITESASGYYHACVRTEDGEVLCFGANDYDQLGDGSK